MGLYVAAGLIAAQLAFAVWLYYQGAGGAVAKNDLGQERKAARERRKSRSRVRARVAGLRDAFWKARGADDRDA